MAECSLCGLSLPDPPVSTEGVSGSYCCRGCLEVARALAITDGITAEDVRERATGERGSVIRGSGEQEHGMRGGRMRGSGEPEHGRQGDGMWGSGEEADVRERGAGVQSSATSGNDELAEAFLAIDGMHCTTCEGFLELLGERHEGIVTVEASYASGGVRVVYDPARLEREALPDLLSAAGYAARFRDEEPPASREDDRMARLLIGGFCAMLLMPWYLFWLYPSYVGIETGIITADLRSPVGLYVPMLFIGVLSTVVLCYTGFPVLRGAYVSLRARRPNMDLLIALAAGSAYAYSTVALAVGSTHLYYDVTVAVIMVVTVGKHYERGVKDRAGDLLSTITAARVDEARRRVDGRLETVSIDDLVPGDELVVRPGERVPVDGTVREGTAAVDESILTGESLPAVRGPGDDVVGGSIVTDSALVVAVGADAASTLDRIATLLWRVQSGTPGAQRLVDRLSTIFVPTVIALATVVFAWRVLATGSVSGALLAALTVLVVSCPCAMGLATPLAVAGGIRDALERGLVVTNAALFEAAPDVDTIVFDKTGTLTTGSMTVRRVVGEQEGLYRGAAVEGYSSHPAGRAIRAAVAGDGGDRDRQSGGRRGGSPIPDGGATTAVDDQNPATGEATVPRATGFERFPGEGVGAVVEDDRIVVGTPTLVEREVGPLDGTLEAAVEAAREHGDLPVVVGWGGRARTVAVVGDETRATWDRVLAAVGDREIVVLTGDDEAATVRYRDHPSVDRVFAGVPPDGKVAAIERLRTRATVAMVGDGTNDAPALAAADVGIALGSGTARAAEAADVVVTTDDLEAVSTAFDVADGTRRRLRENVCWALCYNAIAIPLAVVGLINPLFAALAMAASSAIVVTNSSRSVLREKR